MRGVAVIGAGPAGLMAAEVLSGAGCTVTVYDRMPSPARKLLIAGRGGLNLTHSEPLARFVARYGAAAQRLKPIIEEAGGKFFDWKGRNGLYIEDAISCNEKLADQVLKFLET